MPNLARLALLLLALPVAAQADQLVTLVIQNHTFSPSTFEVPAGERFRIQLTS
ncbi:MAG: cupredoxin domain-containing protein, partial [Pseudomonas sp.]